MRLWKLAPCAEICEITFFINGYVERRVLALPLLYSQADGVAVFHSEAKIFCSKANLLSCGVVSMPPTRRRHSFKRNAYRKTTGYIS